MIMDFIRRLAVLCLHVVNFFRLRSVLLWVFVHLPRRVRRDLGLLQVRLGLMEGLLKVPEPELRRSLEEALQQQGPTPSGLVSAYLEFGVYVGTSMACMYHAAVAVGAGQLRLIGFDSFEGMPASDDPKEAWAWQPGQLFSDQRLTRANLRRLGVPPRRVVLVPGWFDHSLTDRTRARLGVTRAAVIMFDCVLESSTRAALEWCTPLIVDEAVAFFDDWKVLNLHERGLGEAKALRDWLADHPEMEAIARDDLNYGTESQAFILRRRAAEVVAAAG